MNNDELARLARLEQSMAAVLQRLEHLEAVPERRTCRRGGSSSPTSKGRAASRALVEFRDKIYDFRGYVALAVSRTAAEADAQARDDCRSREQLTMGGPDPFVISHRLSQADAGENQLRERQRKIRETGRKRDASRGGSFIRCSPASTPRRTS
jgi:hypothetical protein